MPQPSHRRRSSSSPRSPKHRSGGRRSRSRSPRRRRSPSPRRRSPPRSSDFKRRSPFKPRRHSLSPRKRSPQRRSPPRKRSPSPRHRGSSPKSHRRPSPRIRSPPRESRHSSSHQPTESRRRDESPSVRKTVDSSRDAGPRESERPEPRQGDRPRHNSGPGRDNLDAPSSNQPTLRMDYESSRHKEEELRMRDSQVSSSRDMDMPTSSIRPVREADEDVPLSSRTRAGSRSPPYRNAPMSHESDSRRDPHESQRSREDYSDHPKSRDHERDEEPSLKRSVDEDAHRFFPPSTASTVPDKGSISSRFAVGTKYERPFIATENITVGIQRNLKNPDEDAPIKRDFHAADVFLSRRRAEGEVPLSSRDEFETRPELEEEEEVEERRIISVVRPEPEKSSSFPHENFEVRREHFKPSLRDKWMQGDSRVIESSGDRSRNKSDSRKELGHRERPSRDQRHVKDSGHKRSMSDSDFRRDDFRGGREKEKFERDPSDLRHNLAVKRRKESESDDRPDRETKKGIKSRIGDRRDKLDKDNLPDFARRQDKDYLPDFARRHDKDDLPDFARRQDKYSYAEWKDKPEMIPKGPSYYEHDNRDTFVPRGRGFRGGRFNVRGRGGRGFSNYRGRGTGFRGQFRGSFNRFSRSSADREREWKHDKYSEIEDNKDERPSSTTEK